MEKEEELKYNKYLITIISYEMNTHTHTKICVLNRKLFQSFGLRVTLLWLHAMNY